MSPENRSHWREQLQKTWHIATLDELGARVRTFSPGDQVIFYFCALLICVASFLSMYALEQSLLIEVPTYGGGLTEGVVGSPQFINPLLVISDADRDLSALTYAGLMGFSQNGELIPVLAENYSVSDDGKSYTFVLRKNAKFTDGTPITATDVVFTVQKAQDTSLKSPEYANWTGVNVVALDQRTIRFTLAKPYAPFLGLTTLGILPEHLWRSVSSAEFPFSTLETSPVGAGPFKVASISRDASGLIKSVLLTENPYYILGRPYLDSIRFNFYASAEDLASALKNSAVESAYGVPMGRVLTAPYARVFGIFFNQSEKPVYARAEVRKALSIAINRDSIVRNTLGGYATAIMGPVPPGGMVKQTPVPTSSDPIADAVTVLTKAGWTYDGTARQWKGPSRKGSSAKQTLDTITIRTSNAPELKNVASAVKEDWEKLGVPVNIELYEPGDLSQNVILPRKYDSILYGEVIGRDQDLYAFWDSQERNNPGLNIALYANKDVDSLLDDARSNVDKGMRAADLQHIEDTIAADYPAAFIYAPDFTYTVPEGLRGVRLQQIITPADRFANVASWYRFTDQVWPFFVQNK